MTATGRPPRGLKVVTLTPGGGYGDAGCQYVAGLHALGLPVTWTPTILDATERQAAARNKRNLQSAIGQDLLALWDRPLDCDAILVHMPPVQWHDHWRQAAPDLRPFTCIAWEVAQIPDDWLPALNLYERIFVPSTFTRQALAATDIEAAIDVVPHIARDVTPQSGGAPWGEVADDDFVFYAIGSWTTRKAMEETVRAYLDAFTGDDKVALIVKTGPVDKIALYALPDVQRQSAPPHHAMVWWRLAQILADYDNPAKVHLIAERLPAREIDRLHTRGDCFVSLSRSEGWGLGSFDAVLFGNPVIVTGWGGHLDYLGADYPLLVGHVLEATSRAASDGFFKAVLDACWARADRDHASELMRRVFEDRASARAIARELQPQLRTRYSADRVCRRLAALMGFEVGA